MLKLDDKEWDVVSIHFDAVPPYAISYVQDENGQFILKDGFLQLQKIEFHKISMEMEYHAD